MTRPRLLTFVVGTGTDVGKTWVSALVLTEMSRRGWSVAARKPGQSYEVGSDGGPLDPTDAELLGAATGEAPDSICPPARSYPTPAAPPIAAQRLGLAAPTTDTVAHELETSWPALAVDFGLVEGAGGLLSPIARGAVGSGDTMATLIPRFSPEVVVLVADPGLGTIHQVRAAALPIDGPRLIVHLNRFDPASETHSENKSWLAEIDGRSVTTTIDALAATLETLIPRHCATCGEATSGEHGCRPRPLDPARHCERCGRVVRVLVTPLGHSATCRVHGPLPSSPGS